MLTAILYMLRALTCSGKYAQLSKSAELSMLAEIAAETGFLLFVALAPLA